MSTLDLVVPFTTPALTRAAIAAAERLSSGLSGHIRLLRIEVIPFPEDVRHPALRVDFVRKQLATFRSALPMRAEVVLSREYDSQLENRLTPESVVVLASRFHYWPSRSWRLARRLRRAGHSVVLVRQEKTNA